jgi:hypothetical protein
LAPARHRQPAGNSTMFSAAAARRAGVPVHRGRVGATARSTRTALKHACAWNTEAGLRPRPPAGPRHSQNPNEPESPLGLRANPSRIRIRANPAASERERTQAGRRLPRPELSGIRTNPKPVESGRNPASVESERTQACRKLPKPGAPCNPNEPEAARAFSNPRSSDGRRVPRGRFPAVRPHAMILRSTMNASGR